MTDDELKRLFEAARQDNAAAHEETRRYVDRTAAEMLLHVDKKMDTTVVEMRRHFEAVAERLETRIDAVDSWMKRSSEPQPRPRP